MNSFKKTDLNLKLQKKLTSVLFFVSFLNFQSISKYSNGPYIYLTVILRLGNNKTLHVYISSMFLKPTQTFVIKYFFVCFRILILLHHGKKSGYFVTSETIK